MKLISLDSLEPGKKLGRPIYNEKGTLLLGSGVAVSARYIRRLKEMGYSSVYIHEKGYEDIEVSDVISDKTRNEAVMAISETFQQIRSSANPEKANVDKERVTSISDAIVDDLTGGENRIMDLIDLKSFDNYTFLHSVNVSVLSVLVATQSGKFTALNLRDLAIGAILADVGKAHIPIEIVQKRGRLTAEEFKVMKSHTMIGYEILAHRSQMKPVVASVPLQHQEYYNGSGYPKGLKGDNIHPYSRYVALADVYDALTSDRCFKRRLPPHVGLEYLKLGKGTHFDPECLQDFLRFVAPFPAASTVALNTGEIGVVVSNNEEHLDRPIVRILKSPDGKELEKPYEIDLAKNADYVIEDVRPG